MISNLVKKLKNVTIKLWLLFLLLAQTIYIIMQTYSIPRISHEAGNLLLFDMKPLGYTYEYAFKFLSQLSENGYSLYKYVQLPLDILFPILNCITGLSTFILLLRLYNKAKNRSDITTLSSFSKAILSLPLIAMLFDYLENIMIFLMLSYKSAVPKIIVYAADIFTIIKSMSTSIFYLITILIFIICCATWIRNRTKKEKIKWKVSELEKKRRHY
ncbi:hypothetical protein [Bacillus sp. T3]|uniref:hypothetical protein n=1 Tax=Bacillus sp. T3 TaxID=467262 RepID=UPI0029811C96|nr:hypothetical protein [Bacillus sp. T3]